MAERPNSAAVEAHDDEMNPGSTAVLVRRCPDPLGATQRRSDWLTALTPLFSIIVMGAWQ